MSTPYIILDCLPSSCQKLSDLVEVSRSYNKNNFACFFLRQGVLSNRVCVCSERATYLQQLNFLFLFDLGSRLTRLFVNF